MLIVPLLSIVASFAFASPNVLSNFKIIERDVCVIGGGASGTYAAVRLQQEGKSVALIEKQDRLGGHVNTYRDSTTNQTVDYGVQVFSNLPVLQSFFQHFNVPLVSTSLGQGVGLNVNFATGEVVDTGDSPSLGPLIAAVTGYLTQVAKYPGIVNRWDLPYPVPSDLLLDFGDFIQKYNLTALSSLAFSYNQGIGNMLAQPTMYVMKYFDTQIVEDILEGGFVVNGLGNNQLLYDRAQAELGDNAFISSNVTMVARDFGGVNVLVSTPSGAVMIRASKLLLSIPPKLSNLKFLDLTLDEMSVFSKFNNSYYWDAVVKNTGMPDNTSFTNVDPDAPLGVPPLPGAYVFTATDIPNRKLAYYGSPSPLSTAEVQAQILDTINRIAVENNYTVPGNGTEFVAFNDHSPFELTASKDAISDGFYRDLQALQGLKNTWWTGAAWNKHATAQLYNFTEYEILPNLLG